MDLGLRQATYIVTGGSTGLGFATARCLVAEGANVVLVARGEERLTQAVDQLGGHAAGVVGDLADPTLPATVVRYALDRFGSLHGALVSVGGPPAGSVLSTTDEQWSLAIQTVFLGTIRMLRAACDGIRASGTQETAALAVVLSSSAVEVFPGLTTSNGLRPGLGMLVKDLADEVGPEGIRVNGLLPGRIATDRLAHLDEATGDAQGARDRASALIPLRRYGRPQEFGSVAAFLLSPAAAYVTGTLVRVDGGSTRSL